MTDDEIEFPDPVLGDMDDDEPPLLDNDPVPLPDPDPQEEQA